ncbi:MAG TPA: cation transporting ATPase C-terminal domain-containing protein, partial [Bacteroidia bacterium]|nr:cation transporting ATPase C-terminal domain-containing protein [Bacteroidia bacterium]
LIIGNIFLILTKLSKTRSAFASMAEKNVPLLVILVLATSLLLLILSVPFLQSVFSFEFPGFQHFITSLSGAAVLLLLLEAGKYFRNRRHV